MKVDTDVNYSSCVPLDEKAISLNETYILKMCGSRDGKVGIALSDSTCEIYSYDESSLKKCSKLADQISGICDVRFSPQNDSILYIGSADGSIKLWDSRIGNSCSVIFEEDSKTKTSVKPLVSFDVSCNDRVLCGGTELIENDAFMLFWDVRCKSVLGGYWNSHTDDIVQVVFSPQKSNKLLTGGVDGLINVFDINETTEDDALQYSLSVDCAVDKINWLYDNIVSCITQNIDVQIWNIDSADQIHNFSRENIAKTMKGTTVDDCYVVDAYNSVENKLLLITGSYSENKNHLKIIQLIDNKLTLKADLNQNKQIVRCSWYNPEKELLVSGGENGILTLWKGSQTQTSLKSNSTLNKGINKLRVHKNKPY